MVSKWPESNPALRFDAEEADFEKVMNLIRAVRNVRAEMNVPPSRKAKLFIETKVPEIFRAGQAFIERLAFAPEVEIGESFDLPGAAQAITADARILIPMDELIDREKELARLEKEKAACQKDIDFLVRQAVQCRLCSQGSGKGHRHGAGKARQGGGKARPHRGEHPQSGLILT